MPPIIQQHFDTVDPVIAAYAHDAGQLHMPTPTTNLMLELMSSIASQQLSVKAAATIWGRVIMLFDPDHPETILTVSEDELRSAGLSYQKAQYLHNIAKAASEGLVDFGSLHLLSDTEIIVNLTRIKGVGQWTAEMFLIFALGRPDVFSAGDLGLMNGMKKLYQLPNLTKTQAIDLSTKWSPYRSTASLLLWHSLDNLKNTYT